jgi:hypothetical protein
MSNPHRMRPGEVAVVLARVEDKTHTSEDVTRLRNHLDAVGSDDVFSALVREVGEVIGASQTFMASQQPVLTAGTEALQTLAAQKVRENDLEERRLRLQETRLAKLWQPIVTAIVGLLVGAVATYLTAVAGSAAGAGAGPL